MTTPANVVHGFSVSRTALALAGGVALANAGIVLAGWGQEPKSAPEKVGTAIAHGAILGTTTALMKQPFMRTLTFGALVGDVVGNVSSAVIRGDDAGVERPRPGNAWTDITGAIGRDGTAAAKRNAMVVGGIGLVVGGLAGRAITKSWPSTIKWALVAGGAGAGIGAATGALDGAWRGLYQGTGIALGRAVDVVWPDPAPRG